MRDRHGRYLRARGSGWRPLAQRTPKRILRGPDCGRGRSIRKPVVDWNAHRRRLSGGNAAARQSGALIAARQSATPRSGNHRPRTSSMNLSTEEYLSFVKELPHRPRHLSRFSFLGAFLDEMQRFIRSRWPTFITSIVRLTSRRWKVRRKAISDPCANMRYLHGHRLVPAVAQLARGCHFPGG